MKTTFPLAAPGEAGKPEAIISFLTLSSKVGCNNVLEFEDLKNISETLDKPIRDVELFLRKEIEKIEETQ